MATFIIISKRYRYSISLFLLLFLTLFLYFPSQKSLFNEFYKEEFKYLNGIEFNESLERNFHIYNGLTEILEEMESFVKSEELINHEEDEIKETVYIAKSGESLAELSKKFNQDLDVLKFNNPSLKNSLIKDGQKILVYSKNGIFYRVKRNDNLYKIAKIYKVPLENIIMVNDLSSYKILPGQKIFIPNPKLNINNRPLPKVDIIKTIKNINLVKENNIIRSLNNFLWPVKWRGVSSSFGMREHPVLKVERFHKGVDLRAPKGTSVFSPLDGKIVYAGYQRGFGNFIIIKHYNGYMTRFGHLSKIFVNKDDKVVRGSKIAETGATGLCSAPHLHFEVINEKGEYINPEKLRNIKVTKDKIPFRNS